MQNHQVIVIWPCGKPSHSRKHVDFKPERHSIVAGNLVDKKSGRPIGIIQRVYTDAPKAEQLCLSCGTAHEKACPPPAEDLLSMKTANAQP